MSFSLPKGVKRVAVRKTFEKPSRTKQQFKDEVDVNKILERYRRTGQLPAPTRTPSWGVDVSEPVDYQTAMSIVHSAQEHFLKLPATVRARFANDPSRFMAFVRDPANVEELAAMGLATVVPETPEESNNEPPK